MKPRPRSRPQQQAFPEADFSALHRLRGSQGRRARSSRSRPTTRTWLTSPPTPTSFNDQYNDAEKNLIELAKSLPASPVEPIKVAYEALGRRADRGVLSRPGTARRLPTRSSRALRRGRVVH